MQLLPTEAQFVLEVFPAWSKVVEVHPWPTVGNRRHPCLVWVKTPGDGGERSIVLKSCSYWPGVFVEARLFPHLADLGLPVPAILNGPALLDGAPYTLQSVLPGSSLRDSLLSPLRKAEILAEAIGRLHRISLPPGLAPRVSLIGSLVDLMSRPSPWRGDHEFRRAAKRLRPDLLDIDDPLVFSNGDYLPGNFMTDGEQITGFLDFEFAAFQDPLYGLAKFELMPPGTLEDIPLRQPYLEALGKTDRDLAPRVALRCLSLLATRIDINAPDKYGPWLLERLHAALAEC